MPMQPPKEGLIAWERGDGWKCGICYWDQIGGYRERVVDDHGVRDHSSFGRQNVIGVIGACALDGIDGLCECNFASKCCRLCLKGYYGISISYEELHARAVGPDPFSA